VENIQQLINQYLLDAEEEDEAVFDGGVSELGKIKLRKRIDSRTWRQVFQQGDLVKRQILRCARIIFARYFFIPDEEKVNIIEIVCKDTYGETFRLSEFIKGRFLKDT